MPCLSHFPWFSETKRNLELMKESLIEISEVFFKLDVFISFGCSWNWRPLFIARCDVNISVHYHAKNFRAHQTYMPVWNGTCISQECGRLRIWWEDGNEVVLKTNSLEYEGVDWIRLVQDRAKMADSCEPSCSIKHWEFLEQLRDYLPNKGSALRS
jgi:hypothetical protein